MAYLTLNGIEVPVAVDSWEESSADLGSTDRAFSGYLRRSRRSRLFAASFRTTPQPIATARAFQALIERRYHWWDFEAGTTSGYYSSQGLGYTSKSNIVVNTSVPHSGTYELLASANPFSIVYDAWDNSSAYTWAGWVRSPTYNHYVVDSTGAKWQDGVTYGGSTPFLSLSTSGFTLSHASVGYGFDEIFAFPFVLPSGWAAQLYAFAPIYGKLQLGGALHAKGDALTGWNYDGLVAVSGQCRLRQIRVYGAVYGVLDVELREIAHLTGVGYSD